MCSFMRAYTFPDEDVMIDSRDSNCVSEEDLQFRKEVKSILANWLVLEDEQVSQVSKNQTSNFMTISRSLVVRDCGFELDCRVISDLGAPFTLESIPKLTPCNLILEVTRVKSIPAVATTAAELLLSNLNTKWIIRLSKHMDVTERAIASKWFSYVGLSKAGSFEWNSVSKGVTFQDQWSPRVLFECDVKYRFATHTSLESFQTRDPKMGDIVACPFDAPDFENNPQKEAYVAVL